jgi:hypothetical protein
VIPSIISRAWSTVFRKTAPPFWPASPELDQNAGFSGQCSAFGRLAAPFQPRDACFRSFCPCQPCFRKPRGVKEAARGQFSLSILPLVAEVKLGCSERHHRGS